MKPNAKPFFFAVALAAMLVAGSTFAAGGETPLANGVFLVAKPELADPNFRQTVVLITEPQIGGGPLGVIVNRPIAARLSEALPQLGAVPERYEQMYGGGPVATNSLVFLVRSAGKIEGGLQVLADVWLSADPEQLRKIVAGEVKAEALRVYAGYAGWAPGQLQSEIARGGWYVTRAEADTIFAADVGGMWAELIRRLTSRHTRVGPDRICAAPGAC